MLRLIVDQHAVEIEQHGFGHSVSLSHPTTFGQQDWRARSDSTKPRCVNPDSTASRLRRDPTRSTTCRHAAGGAKIRSAVPPTPRDGVLTAPRPPKESKPSVPSHAPRTVHSTPSPTS